MANQIISRVIPKTLTPFFSRSISTTTPSSSAISFLRHLRPLAAASVTSRHILLPSFRALSTRATTSSLNDPNPNWSNRPPKETILLDGCDFEHWLVVMEKPDSDPTRDEIIDSYIKTFAEVIGSEEEARKNIYSVSTRHYFAFGAICSEEVSYKLKDLPKVRWVLPDSYLNVKEKDYGGEPFINGQAVPYDPKYHEEWVRNNARANERNNRSHRNSGPRPRNRNGDMQTRHTMTNRGPNMAGPPPNNAGGYPPNNAGGYAPAPPSNQGGYAPNNTAGGYPPPPNNAGGYAPAPHSNQGGYAPPSNQGGYAPPNAGGYAPNNTGGGYAPPNMGRPPPPNSGYGVPQNNYPGNMGQVPQNQNMGGFPPNAGWGNNQ